MLQVKPDGRVTRLHDPKNLSNLSIKLLVFRQITRASIHSAFILESYREVKVLGRLNLLLLSAQLLILGDLIC